MDAIDPNSDSFVQALNIASAPNYLGSVAVVNKVLCDLANEALKRRSTLSVDEAKELNIADCQRLAAVFLGQDTEDYTPMLPWNSKGNIDRFVANEIGLPARSSERILENMFASYIGDFYRLADYANEPGVPYGNWNWQPSALVEIYVHLLLGIPYPND